MPYLVDQKYEYEKINKPHKKNRFLSGKISNV